MRRRNYAAASFEYGYDGCILMLYISNLLNLERDNVHAKYRRAVALYMMEDYDQAKQ